MKLLKSVVTALSLLFALPVWAGNFHLHYNVRFRYEFRDNFNKKFYGPNPPIGKTRDGFLLGRFRFGADWRPTKTIHIAFWMQDSRAWDWAMPDRAFYNKKLGTYNNPQKDYLELYTTYIKFISPFGLPLDLKIGRQRIAYGDNRVFGPGQWGNSGRYIWDAAKLRLKRGRAFVDVFYGRNMIHEVKRFSLKHRHDKSTLAFYGHIPVDFGPVMNVFEPFAFTKWDWHDRFKGEKGTYGKLNLYYAGLHWTGSWKLLDWNHTWIGMWGHHGSDPVSAYAYHVEGGVNFGRKGRRVRLYLAYSYASGDKNPKDGRNNRFDGAFGSVDKAYGRMNLFKWSNLEDTEGGAELFFRRFKIKLEYHHFRLAQSRDGWSHNPSYYRDVTGASGKEMGHELDVVAHLKLSKWQEIQIGYGHFWPGEFVKELASSKEANWFFVQYEMKI